MSRAKSEKNVHQAEQDSEEDDTNMCLELALEGERLCKAGDCRTGVAFFRAAILSGTDDARTLSAIYSQLGNAYFFLGEYEKALQYHKQDLMLTNTMNDKLGEAKSCGNLGNTYKVIGNFFNAALYCQRHLELARELGDKLSEGRALYNLGNIYHAKGKHIGRGGQLEPGEFSEEAKECLQEAAKYYEENLALMRELGDVAAQGRACGNLGNTYYLLGHFDKAIQFHEERLAIARQFGDKAAERRAHSNLGNSYIFMGQFEEAAQHYKRTFALAQELGDEAIEAQASYSLGNTYTLLRDYDTAIDYHLRHLLIAQHLNDRVGEGRACWSLGNANASLGRHDKALCYAKKHLKISQEINDPMGEATAKMNIADLKRILQVPESPEELDEVTPMKTPPEGGRDQLHRVRRESMEQLKLIKLTPDGKTQPLSLAQTKSGATIKNEDEDSFFDLLSRFQSKRMDDQRCSLSVKGDNNKENKNVVNLPKNDEPEDLFDMITGMQSKRMDEQRVELPNLPGLQSTSSRQRLSESRSNSSLPDEHFLDQLVRCQNSRLDDQRSPLPAAEAVAVDAEDDPQPCPVGRSGATVPDEDFFSLIMRFQSGRMDDQRAAVPRTNNRIANGSVPHHSNDGLTSSKKPSKKK